MDADVIFLQKRDSMHLLAWQSHDRRIIYSSIAFRPFAFQVLLNLSFAGLFFPAFIVVMNFQLTFEFLLYFYVGEYKDDNFSSIFLNIT
jgi:hypothetical protein